MNYLDVSYSETAWIATNFNTWDLLMKHLENPKIKTCISAGQFQKSITQRLCPPSWVWQEIVGPPHVKTKFLQHFSIGLLKREKQTGNAAVGIFFNIFQILLEQNNIWDSEVILEWIKSEILNLLKPKVMDFILMISWGF